MILQMPYPLYDSATFHPAYHQISPWLAAAAMALSSVSVLANSLRLRG